MGEINLLRFSHLVQSGRRRLRVARLRKWDCGLDERHTILLLSGTEGETGIFVLFDESDGARAHCRLLCKYRDKAVESTATDFFQALCDVRSLLAKDGLIPFCYGASLNVYPSGMARDMGQGRKACKLAMGRQARREDLVDIFSGGLDVVPASVCRDHRQNRQTFRAQRGVYGEFQTMNVAPSGTPVAGQRCMGSSPICSHAAMKSAMPRAPLDRAVGQAAVRAEVPPCFGEENDYRYSEVV